MDCRGSGLRDDGLGDALTLLSGNKKDTRRGGFSQLWWWARDFNYLEATETGTLNIQQNTHIERLVESS